MWAFINRLLLFFPNKLWNSLSAVIRESKDIRTLKRSLEAFMSKIALIS